VRRARASGAAITRASQGHVGTAQERVPSQFATHRTRRSRPRRETLVRRDLVKMGFFVLSTARGPASPRRVPLADDRPPLDGVMQGFMRRPRKIESDAGSGRSRSTSEGTGGMGLPPPPADTPPPWPPQMAADPKRHGAMLPRAGALVAGPWLDREARSRGVGGRAAKNKGGR